MVAPQRRPPSDGCKASFTRFSATLFKSCVTAGEVIAQGSNGTVLTQDLNRQLMALLTQGPGSFSGKFIDGLDELQQLAANLAEGKPIDAKKATGVIAAVQKGIDSYKTSMAKYFDPNQSGTLPPEIQAIINDLEELKASLEAPLSTLTACANAPTNATDGGKNEFLTLINFDAICDVPEAERQALGGAKGEVEEKVEFIEEFTEPNSVWGVPLEPVTSEVCFFDENRVEAEILKKFPDRGALKEGFPIRVKGKRWLPMTGQEAMCYEIRYWFDGEPETRDGRGFFKAEEYEQKVAAYHRAIVFLADAEVLQCPEHLRANYAISAKQIWETFAESRTFSNQGNDFTFAITDFSETHQQYWKQRLDCIGAQPSYIEYEIIDLLASLGMGAVVRTTFKNIAKKYALRKGWRVVLEEGGEEIIDVIFTLQKDDFLKYIDNIASLSSNRKGAWGEIASDVFLQEKGWVALHTRKTSILQGWGEKGIDAVFKRGDEYFIVEAKYRDYATLKMTNDGKQMSNPWIDNRLLNAVGGNQAIYDDILNSGYKRLLAEISPNGTVVYKELDASANVLNIFNP